ncbi:MAG: gliding motility-associated ABC transporter substrate-binding protein GldG [Paludibacteraceae bacterium]|nr:gliding motility-associated ABC transporter substrate-binding protein GldG [Paludibacteraceae bacterium]
MKIWKSIAIVVALVLTNILVHHFVVRWDMTNDHRYSLAPTTKALLQELDAPVHISILLDGELNAGFQRLQRATIEMVEEFGAVIGNRRSEIGYRVSAEDIPQGMQPTVIHERTHKGQTAQTTIYPYALMTYKGKTAIVELLRNNRGLSGEQNLNHSIEHLEFAFVEALHALTREKVEKIAFLEGHGELDESEVYDLSQALSYYYQIDRGRLGTEAGVLDAYRAVIIADPQLPFSEEDKYILDQYLMQGGRILWVVNGVRFSNEILSQSGMTPVIPLDLNISDMLFRYGVRVNPALVQDLQCLPMPIDVSADPKQPNWQPMPWTYAPLLLTSQASPITRNVMQVSATMASCIEFVGGEDGLHKTTLLATSSNSKITSTPAEVDLSLFNGSENEFKYAFIPVAASIEGVFPSLFAHLLPPEGIESHAPLRKHSEPTKQIIVAAGSTIRNEWQKGEVLPLGYDRYTQTQFGNRDFMVNAVLYLTDDTGWMSLRQKQFTLCLINDQRAREGRIAAQTISIIIPLLLLLFVGITMVFIRKKQYTNQQ